MESLGVPMFDYQLPAMLEAVDAEIDRLKRKLNILRAEKSEPAALHARHRCQGDVLPPRASVKSEKRSSLLQDGLASH